jgi:transposase-like zinc-binding protein
MHAEISPSTASGRATHSPTSCWAIRVCRRLASAAPSTSYEPRCPAQCGVYRSSTITSRPFARRPRALRDGVGLPRVVEQEFRDFLQCGWLAGGFARFRCDDCGLDRLVPFSCQGRALWPTCGGRRMAERAAHLLDHVFPDVPVRQWVLSLPYRMRYQLARNHDVCRGVVAVFVRAVLGRSRPLGPPWWRA